MKKFVIAYVTGSYDTQGVHIYTMEAESKTDIQLWILAAIEQWKLVSVELEKLQNDPLRKTDHLTWYEKYKEWLGTDYDKLYNLDVNGYKLYLPDDLNQDFDHLTIFTITELDEWFENNKPEKVNKNDKVRN